MGARPRATTTTNASSSSGLSLGLGPNAWARAQACPRFDARPGSSKSCTFPSVARQAIRQSQPPANVGSVARRPRSKVVRPPSSVDPNKPALPRRFDSLGSDPLRHPYSDAYSPVHGDHHTRPAYARTALGPCPVYALDPRGANANAPHRARVVRTRSPKGARRVSRQSKCPGGNVVT